MSISDVRKRLFDHTYGELYGKGRWMMGDSSLEIDEDDNIHIKGIYYGDTPGLYELLFMREPERGVNDKNDEITCIGTIPTNWWSGCKY